MATITNGTAFCISVVAKSPTEESPLNIFQCAIDPGARYPAKPDDEPISDEVATDWFMKKDVRAHKGLRIMLDGGNAQHPASEEGKKEQWQKVVKHVKACKDLGELETILATDERPAVQAACDARLEALRIVDAEGNPAA